STRWPARDGISPKSTRRESGARCSDVAGRREATSRRSPVGVSLAGWRPHIRRGPPPRQRMTDPAPSITQLLQDVRAEREGAVDRLATAVYEELHRVASAYLRRERAGHTLQPTALV